MEEEKDDLFSLFSNDINLNLDYSEENDEEVEDDETKPVEDDNPEDVDGEEDDDNEGDEDGQSDDNSSPNLYSSILDVLVEQGLLPSLESSENIKTVDDFTEAFKKEIENQANLRLEKTLSNLDLEKIANSRKNSIELDAVDEDYLKSNLEVAKNIILQDYLNQGLSEERARRQLKKAIDLGEDIVIEEALESKESIKLFNKKQEDLELENSKKEQERLLQEQQEIDTQIKKYIFESKEVVKGIQNTKAISDRVFKTMTEVVSKNPKTGELENKFMSERSKNPIEFDTKMYYMFELTNGFTDLSKIKTNLTSSATKRLEEAIRKTKFEDDGTPSYIQDPESYGGIGSELVY